MFNLLLAFEQGLESVVISLASSVDEWDAFSHVCVIVEGGQALSAGADHSGEEAEVVAEVSLNWSKDEKRLRYIIWYIG